MTQRQREGARHMGGMDEDDEFDLIGSMPPALVAEMDAAGDDVRSQEVARVLRGVGLLNSGARM